MISPFGVEHGEDGYQPLWYEVSKGYLRAMSDVARIGAKQAKTVATTKSSTRLAHKAKLGAEHAAREKKSGFPYSAESKPMPFHPRARKAWEQGYRNG